MFEYSMEKVIELATWVISTYGKKKQQYNFTLPKT